MAAINLRDRDGLHGRLFDIKCPVMWLHVRNFEAVPTNLQSLFLKVDVNLMKFMLTLDINRAQTTWSTVLPMQKRRSSFSSTRRPRNWSPSRVARISCPHHIRRTSITPLLRLWESMPEVSKSLRCKAYENSSKVHCQCPLLLCIWDVLLHLLYSMVYDVCSSTTRHHAGK